MLTFDHPVTAIVGPNGSGKSNLSDAICWVLGEQSARTLRGDKMEDVIFSGAQLRQRLGAAQVTLRLEDETGGEMAVTRRYYRSGESEYLLNGKTVRLRDVHERFMDTGLGQEGYALIGQGKIDAILSAKSTQRREIFEEAAGISHCRHQKEETQRKLERTQENLVRINDKIAELELQVEPLRKQAETAKKYLHLRDELKSAEVSVWMETLDRLHAQAETVNHDYQTAKENLAGAQRELEQLYAASENIAQKMREKDLESERTREQISEAESAAAECESAAAVVRTNLQNSADSIARLRVEVSEQADRASALQAQIDAQQQRLEQIEREKAQHAQQIDAVLEDIERNAASSGEAERAYTELLARESAQSSALAECRTRITLLADKSQELLDQENAIVTAAAEAAERLAALEAQAQEKQTAQQQAQSACDALRTQQREKTQHLSACEQALAKRQERLSGLTVDLRSTESRIRMLTEMEKDFEGYNRAVKAVMHAAEKGTLRGVRGPVANLIKTGDRYALAIETALGAAAQNIVVETQSCGAQAIDLLRRRDTGRATFLPLDTIRPMHLNSVPDQEPGYVGVADTLVTCAAAYRDIVSNLLGRTVVAETMKDAIAISRRYDHRYRIVTLDGQLVNAGGSLTGGSAAKGSGILSRANELKRLRETLDALTLEKQQCALELEDAQAALDAAHAQLDTVQAQLEQAVETLHRAQSEAAQVVLLQNAAQETIAGQNASIDACRAQQKTNQERIAAARADAASAEETLAQLRAERDQSELGRGAFDRRRQELADRLAGLRAETASLEAERETILRTTQQIHDLFEEMAGDRKARLDQIAQAETGTQQLQQTLQMHERRLAELRQRAETLRGELAACSGRKLELEGQRTRTDRDAQARNRDLLDMQGLVSRFEQKKLSADMEEKQILDKLWDNYELSRTAAEALRQPIENMTKASRRIAELRRGIGALGTPNLGAIDEFTRVNTRYTFLTGQRDDILKAKRELTGIIADVTGEMEGIFTTQFQAIDQAFRQTFLELFGGGKAALVLEDPEHVLDSGIEIKVQPPGKALSTLSLMSGGEMAFVAIALYFAILKVRPTPFCVMDEIEAALDEANVTRYVQYMRRLAKSTQFLVITHRRGTMEEADHLFGVTMQEKGVSRIIELSLDEAAKTIS